MNARVLKSGTILNNRYEIKKQIGDGGFSLVYMALDLLVYRMVAVKELFPDEYITRDVNKSNHIVLPEQIEDLQKIERCRKCFERESAVLDRLKNIPYISGKLNSFETNGTMYIVMNLIQGQSLADYIKNCGSIQLSVLLPLMEKVLYAMEMIHNAGVIHRDISPKNLILTEEQDLYLIDFGAATAIDLQDPQNADEVFEHKGFQAPESLQRNQQGTWTDIYSFCAVFLYLLSGSPIGDPEVRRQYDTVPHILTRCKLTSRQQNALINGLKLGVGERLANAKELRKELCQVLYIHDIERNVRFGCKTSIGTRDCNQDNVTVDGLFYFEGRDFERYGEIVCKPEEIHAIAVCDGVGGANAGELASMAAIQAVTHFLEQNRESDMLPERLLDEFLDQLNEKIVAFGKKVGKTATTISLLLWKNHHYYAINIGDSPIYFLHKRKIEVLSTKHTLAEKKRMLGQNISMSDTHVLINYLGKEKCAGSQLKSFRHGHLEKGDIFMVCTDGLTNKLSQDKIRKFLRSDTRLTIKKMWQVLDKQKECDNCSVAIIEFI